MFKTMIKGIVTQCTGPNCLGPASLLKLCISPSPLSVTRHLSDL